MHFYRLTNHVGVMPTHTDTNISYPCHINNPSLVNAVPLLTHMWCEIIHNTHAHSHARPHTMISIYAKRDATFRVVVFKRKKRLRSDIFGRARGRFIRDAHTFSVNVFFFFINDCTWNGENVSEKLQNTKCRQCWAVLCSLEHALPIRSLIYSMCIHIGTR